MSKVLLLLFVVAGLICPNPNLVVKQNMDEVSKMTGGLTHEREVSKEQRALWILCGPKTPVFNTMQEFITQQQG